MHIFYKWGRISIRGNEKRCAGSFKAAPFAKQARELQVNLSASFDSPLPKARAQTYIHCRVNQV